jgi:hypothetical protein
MHNPFYYIKFWIKANNQHGIHSPFIYNFVTKGLYIKHKYCRSSSLNTFFKCVDYFKPKSIDFEGDNELLRNKVKSEFPSISYKAPYEMKYYDSLESESQISAMAAYAKQQPKGIIFIADIRTKRISEELWNKLIMANFAIVTIDMYYGGLLFFHSTQAKQHFKIRI